MLNQEEFKGFWYPADRPDIRFHATLNFAPDKSPRLKGIGTFTEEQTAFLRSVKEMTVWGDLEGGEKATLFECNCLSVLLPLPGTQNIELNAHTVIFGVLLRNDEELTVHSAQLRLTVLTEWMDIYGHKTGYDDSTDTHSLLYNAPEDVPFSINERLQGAFIFRLVREVNGATVSFRQENSLSLKFSVPVSYKEAQESAWKIQRFLTIAVWQQLNIASFSIRVKVSQGTEDNDGYRWCRIFFVQSTYGRAEEDNKTYFLKFAVVRPIIEALLQTWFRLEDITEPVINLLIANTGKEDGFVQNNFLNLAQAVEAFHRHVKQDTDRLKAEHIVRMERILREVKEATDKKWLSEKLEHAFEPSLRKRLKELFTEHCTSIFYNKDFSKKSVAKVIDTITEKRNYYTHYGEKFQETDADFMQLVVLTKLLKLLLAVMMFRELGIDKDVLRDSISGRLKVRLQPK